MSTAIAPGAWVDAEHVWNQVLDDRNRGRPALFLDRDGVILVEVGYLHEPDRADLIPGAAETIRRANSAAAAVVVVTNQAGIARGMYGWPEFEATQARMLDRLAGLGARVDAVFACPHHADGVAPYRHPNHPARKPNPGLLSRAAEQLDLDMGRSWIVGDRTSDLAAGRRAGLAGGVLVATGYGSRPGEVDRATTESAGGFAVAFAASLGAASAVIPLLNGAAGPAEA